MQAKNTEVKNFFLSLQHTTVAIESGQFKNTTEVCDLWSPAAAECTL
jgi:hypothetical protein